MGEIAGGARVARDGIRPTGRSTSAAGFILYIHTYIAIAWKYRRTQSLTVGAKGREGPVDGAGRFSGVSRSGRRCGGRNPGRVGQHPRR